MVVVIKLMAPKIEDKPAKCREKIAISTLGAEWDKLLERGGYTVQPVPTPDSIFMVIYINKNEDGRSQNLKLFVRGYLISGALSIRGRIQLPNPPIKIGITIKKIITIACAVTSLLKNCSDIIFAPGWESSMRIKSLINIPDTPAHIPTKR